MIRSTFAAALAALAMLAAPAAMAQTCTQIPLANTCSGRGVPLIDRVVPGVGGDRVCASYAGAPAPVQYDTYVVQAGYLFYACTRFRTCLWVRNNDTEAWQAFCN